MKVKDIANTLKAKIMNGDNYINHDVEYAFASDLMSDVLTLQSDNVLLITGLSNLQAIRTAEMSDISVVIIARNKKVNPDMISLANENNIVLLESEYSMYRVAGELYKAGIKPVY